MSSSNIEQDFQHIFENGEVVFKDGYHQPQHAGGTVKCGCDLMTDKGSYRHIKVNYSGVKFYFYHQTAIVRKISSDNYVITDGGYDTWSTRQRIKKYLPQWINLKRVDGETYVVTEDERVKLNGEVTINKP